MSELQSDFCKIVWHECHEILGDFIRILKGIFVDGNMSELQSDFWKDL